MKIVIPGGTGQVGQILARYFAAGGHEVVLFARSQRQSTGRTVLWDGRTVGTWSAELEGADVVINLAGRSVDCRYNSANRGEILRSRVDSTRVLGEVISGLRNPPRVWLQAGTATIYAHRFDGPNDEQNGIIGGDEPGAPDTWRFSVEVAKAWEDAFQQAPTLLTRKVIRGPQW